jgi:hypothetical protein
MQMPAELDIHTASRREALLQEAELERLARSVAGRRPTWRVLLASALYALAARLDPSATIPIVERARAEARGA